MTEDNWLAPKRKSYFDKKQVAALIPKYKLKKKFGKHSLIDQLDLCADIYFRHKRGMDYRQPVKSIKKELEEIEALSKSLKEKLTAHHEPDDLDDGAQYMLRQVANKFSQEAFIQKVKKGDDEKIGIHSVPLSHGLFATSLNIGDQGSIQITYEMDEILTALTHLETYAAIAKEGLKKGAPGRRTSHALKNWVTNMEIIWRDFKGGEFHLTRPNGVIKSTAALFCIEVLALIDPDAKEATIANTMRAHIKKGRNQKVQ
tara:strand:+ start:849 stop:1622 length:774 start_codon:yes stop_codon:yes gene_type:complete